MPEHYLLWHLVPSWHSLTHPLEGLGYQFWSGFGSDFGEATLATGFAATLIGFWVRHNCHVHGCWRLSWHTHPDHGHPVCKVHHPEHPRRGGTRIGADGAGH